MKKTWFTIDGSLEPIDFPGESYFRFPIELAEIVIKEFSNGGDLVFDPFAGFGTTLVAAEKLDRRAVGIEKEKDRFEFASQRISAPNKIFNANCLDANKHDIANVDLLFTSPPYQSFRDHDKDGFDNYKNDFKSIFNSFKPLLNGDATIVVEISNVLKADQVKPAAFEVALLLSEIFEFQGEFVRCNTGGEIAGPGYDHSYLLVFKNT